MPGESQQTVSGSARVVNLYDLDLEEESLKCVHLKAGSTLKRCGNKINKQDCQRAWGIYLKIWPSVTDATALQDCLSTLAKLTLCNHVHRPRDGTESLYARMVQKWSNDFHTQLAAIEDASVTDAVTDCKESPENTISPGSDPRKFTIIHSEGLPLGPRNPEDGHSLDEPAILVGEKHILEERKDLSLDGTRKGHCSGNGAITISPPQPLPKRVTRSGTLFQPDDEYLPYCPGLLTLTPSELIHRRNTSLLSLLSRPLAETAKKNGCVYIFTRPDDPSLVKIGFTKHSGEARTAAWGKGCCYAARLEFATEMIPHAWQVERLVQEQLKQYRRKERKCKWKATCSTQHQEWYEIGAGEAQSVVETWAAWITKYRPWGADGVLTRDWARLLDRYRIALKGPDCDADLWDRWARMEEPSEASPVVSTPNLQPTPERHSASTGLDNLDLHQTSSSSSTAGRDRRKAAAKIPLPAESYYTKTRTSLESGCSHAADSKLLLKLRLSVSPPKCWQRLEIDCSSPISATPSPPASPTMLRTPGIWRPAHQASSDALRAALKSALASLDAYSAASSGANGHHAHLQQTIRSFKKPIARTWTELEQGYCTA
jgi:T5orf172 domain